MPATLNNTGVLFNDSSQQSTAYLGHRVAIYTSSSTFTPPAGVTQLKITAVGGGGGGGSWDGTVNGRSNGGLGACAIALVTVTGGTSYTVTIGGGGTGASPNYTNQTGEDGTAGGETWFGINSSNKLISCGGGAGGTANWDPGSCCFPGWSIVSSFIGADGTSSTTGTLIRSGDAISAGGTTVGTISSTWIAWGLSYQLFGGRPVWNDTGGTAAQTWTTSSKYIPGCGGVYGGVGSSSYGGMSGCMLIEY